MSAIETEPKRYPRELAIEVAREIALALKPQCRSIPGDPHPRLKIVGSVRRGRQDVKDLELLYVPGAVQVTDAGDLFGAKKTANAAEIFFEAALHTGFLTKRPKCDGTFTWGADIKLAVHARTGLPVDFFAATPENWFNLLVCRTGGAQTNIRIAAEAKARGWRWSPNGPGFLRPDHYWLLVQSERDVFRALGLSAGASRKELAEQALELLKMVAAGKFGLEEPETPDTEIPAHGRPSFCGRKRRKPRAR